MMLPEYTVKCGGHAAAAGLTIQKADFDAFKDAFTKLCHDRNDISKNNVSPPLDAIVDSSELNEEFVRSLSALEPFGEGFPEPLFGLTADIDEVRFMGQGQKHVKYMDTRHNVSIIEWVLRHKDKKLYFISNPYETTISNAYQIRSVYERR